MVFDREIDNAVAILRAGGLVAFPTETVYGLGADASNPEAVKRVFAAKGRPHDHPLIVHVADAVQLANWAREIPPAAWTLARKFWPGPLTLILKRSPRVNDLVTGGQDTVALRVPSHPVAQALLRRFGGGVAAPSANRFGRVSATTAEHVRREFGGAVDCVLDGGAADVGIESTIVDLSGAAPALLRPGWITVEQLQDALGMPLASPDTQSPRAPGTLAKHYAPQTPLMVMEADLLLELAASLARQGKRIAVLARSALQPLSPGLTWVAAPQDAAGYAHQLYASLRQLDEAGCDTILVEAPPQDAAWAAIRDRLTRAAAGTQENLA
ncbi:MAG: threonylcarbamoyl-AMP synthase [Betaproteobacteria bacterium RIFCSPLOWO2_12_FULL_62_13]|nr:MAG: threonylcarbamoyl-AMP synthase [Betaproteobacteria bacterium RIFCSPLOWO2_12_FULL_62_13]